MPDVTRILNAIEGGDAGASEELLPLVYEQLRLLAYKKLSFEKPGQTLQATALVHEAYVRLVGSSSQQWDGRGHFFAAAAEAMRRILVENARRKKCLKRGGCQGRVPLDELSVSITGPNEDIIALSEALDRFEAQDAQAANLVKLHYFSGLTIEQAAQISGIARRTAVNHLAYARAWLQREISKGDD